MHELSATEAVLSATLDAARRAGARRVLAVELAIGDLSALLGDSVQLYFDVLSRGTLAEGARLAVRRVPGEAACVECGARWAARPPLAAACPRCGGPFVRVTGGRELLVESIEIDADDEPTSEVADARAGGG